MTSIVSHHEIHQLRRAAKQLSRLQSCSHTAALDAVAKAKGYQNWSVLMMHRAPEDAGAPSLGAATPSTTQVPLAGPQFLCTRDELAVVTLIVKRFHALVGDRIEVDRLSLMMDLEACHCNGCPLDLVTLLEASSDMDLVHDVAGITRHLDRETGKLMDCFLPRYAMTFSKSLAA